MNAYLGYEFNLNLQFSYTALKGTVIAKYVDVNGKVLSDDIITKKMVGVNYQTSSKEFDGYKLVSIKGEETGKYIDGEIVVIYVYERVEEPVMMTTNEAEIIPPKTSVSSNILSFMELSIMLLISGLIYVRTKEFN